MGIENLRKIVIKESRKKPFVFLKFAEHRDGIDIWERNGESYTRKGAYDAVVHNRHGYEFVCNDKVREEFSLETCIREEKQTLYYQKNRRRAA